MYKTLGELSSVQLLEMLTFHVELFYLPYCENEDDVSAEYNLRKAILDILSQRNEQEYFQRMTEIRA
jgi:hypothetical protein